MKIQWSSDDQSRFRGVGESSVPTCRPQGPGPLLRSSAGSHCLAYQGGILYIFRSPCLSFHLLKEYVVDFDGL